MCHTDPTSRTLTVSHDSLSIPMGIIETEQDLRYYDTVLDLKPGFTDTLIRYVFPVKQDDAYNYGVCVLTTTIIYLYDQNPCDFPWQILNYPTVAIHMRNIIIAILHTDYSPVLKKTSILITYSLWPRRQPSSTSFKIPCTTPIVLQYRYHYIPRHQGHPS